MAGAGIIDGRFAAGRGRADVSKLIGAAGRSTCQVAGTGIIAGRFAAGRGRARCRVINGLLRRGSARY